ncbi:thioesterase domain-containing protein [Nocardia sp. NPDC049190]|uniref:thioesterase domain-containing protein n=1 Tax=Nocardia sp. NPDC049190 TaxID=3155650 RepID=UPI003400455F
MSSGLTFSNGAQDPRLYDVDDDFQQLLTDFAQLTAMGKLTRSRVFHAPGIVVRGHIDFFDTPGVPVHPFFAGGKRYPVLARYSNGVSSDDLAPGIRGLSLRWFDPDGSDSSPFNLTFNTGYRVFAPNAWTFMKFFMLRDDAAREELVRATPGALQPAVDAIRDAHPYHRYHLNSQVPQLHVDGTGRPWLVRYRLIPDSDLPDVGHHTPRGWVVPPIERLLRTPEERRSSTLLRDEVRTLASSGELRGLFQIQLHPLGDDAAANQAALSPAADWPVASHPFRTIGEIHLDRVCDEDPAAELPFDPADAPEGLGIALARSPFEAASMNHARSLVYRSGHAARTAPPAPASPGFARNSYRPAQGDDGGRTICVIGAGPGGLAAAHHLERLGHTVVVLEREVVVGGKSVSMEIDGRVYDLGAHLCNDRYEHLIALADEFGVDTEDIVPPHIFDAETFTARIPRTAFLTRESVGRYMRVRAEKFPDIGRPGLAHSARALSQPAREWLRDNDLDAMATSFETAYTSAGYGYLADNLPALYFLKVSETLNQLSTELTRARHVNAFTIAGGFGALWERIAASLADVRTGVEITEIDRSGDRVAVHTTAGTVHADDLVLAVPLDQLGDVLDMTPAEHAVGSKVRRLDFYTVLCRITGLPRNGPYTVRNGSASPGPGHCVSYHSRYAGTDVYACYSYGAEDVGPDDILANLRDDVVRFGGELTEVLYVRRWPYFPHFASEDLADGIYDKLEALQGRRRTYHVGGLPGFEMIETTIAHAHDLVTKHFARKANDVTADADDRQTQASGGHRTDEISSWLISRLAREFRIAEDEIDEAASLDDFPLDSLAIAALHVDLSEWLGFRVPPTVLLENPTIESAARRLAQATPGAPSNGVSGTPTPFLAVPLTPPRPLFCVTGANGLAYQFRPLAAALGPWCAFTALQAPGHDGAEPTLSTVEALAQRYLRDIRAVQPSGPYLISGYSLGGLMAYEIACRLRAAGEEVGEVVLIDSYLPLPGQPTPPWDESGALDELMAMLRATGGASGSALVLDPQLSLAQRRDAVCRELTSGGIAGARRQLEFLLRVYQANLEANIRYRPPRSDLSVTLLRANEQLPMVFSNPDRAPAMPVGDRAYGWGAVQTGRFRIIDVPGNHFTLVTEDGATGLADALREVLTGGHALSGTTS